ncbi:protein qua-1-like [Drosophila obscura]|uniref:protein qua-1-like n=1 Tax=Drosophila obscura TaxID=7282 RepID=UPI001BB2759A|nr:protein qua-1-like [Drosophila obscura]
MEGKRGNGSGDGDGRGGDVGVSRGTDSRDGDDRSGDVCGNGDGRGADGRGSDGRRGDGGRDGGRDGAGGTDEDQGGDGDRQAEHSDRHVGEPTWEAGDRVLGARAMGVAEYSGGNGRKALPERAGIVPGASDGRGSAGPDPVGGAPGEETDQRAGSAGTARWRTSQYRNPAQCQIQNDG